jgi:hypothetical protein
MISSSLVEEKPLLSTTEQAESRVISSTSVLQKQNSNSNSKTMGFGMRNTGKNTTTWQPSEVDSPQEESSHSYTDLLSLTKETIGTNAAANQIMQQRFHQGNNVSSNKNALGTISVSL